MARPPSWLKQISAIRKLVQNSNLTHYSTADVQRMFGLMPRASRAMFEMLPTVKLGGTTIWVERPALLRFLERVCEADDVHGLFAQMRAEKERPSRRRPHTVVRRESEAIQAADLARWVSRGRVAFDFASVEEFADIMWRFAVVLQDDQGVEDFCDLYEPVQPASVEVSALRAEKDWLTREIEELRERWERKNADGAAKY